MSPARCAAGLRQAAVANMQTEAARRRATETKLIRAMERWEAKAAAMTPEKGAAFIRHKLKERVRLQAKYSTRRRPVIASHAGAGPLRARCGRWSCSRSRYA